MRSGVMIGELVLEEVLRPYADRSPNGPRVALLVKEHDGAAVLELVTVEADGSRQRIDLPPLTLPAGTTVIAGAQIAVELADLRDALTLLERASQRSDERAEYRAELLEEMRRRAEAQAAAVTAERANQRVVELIDQLEMLERRGSAAEIRSAEVEDGEIETGEIRSAESETAEPETAEVEDGEIETEAETGEIEAHTSEAQDELA